MVKSKSSKVSSNNRNSKKLKVGLKPKQKIQSQIRKHKRPLNPKATEHQAEDPILFGSGPASDSDSEANLQSPTHIHSVLEPLTKPQLISFLLDAAASYPDFRARIRSLADSDASHRTVFVHGLSWDSTKDTLVEAFSPFGEIDDCSVIIDKLTGRSKGYGFVLFKSRSGAVKALKEPQKMIKNRRTSCNLASIRTVKTDITGRRIYVSNVPWDASQEKLKAFFARFGEIETGPFGFDMVTGKSRGFAIFVYKNLEDAKKVLEEPCKMFEGRSLYCKIATAAGKGQKVGAAQLAPAVQQAAAVPPAVTAAQPIPAAMSAAQNLALLGQNPQLAAALNPGLLNAGLFGWTARAPSPLGAYGTVQSPAGFGFLGYQGGSASQGGQASSGNAGGGRFPPSFM